MQNKNYNKLFDYFLSWSPHALMKKEAYEYYTKVFNRNNYDPNPLITGKEEIIAKPINNSSSTQSRVYLYSEDTDNIIKIINNKINKDNYKTKIFLMITFILILLKIFYQINLNGFIITFFFLIILNINIKNIILINGDYIYLGGGCYEYGLRTFEEEAKKTYPNKKLKELNKIELDYIWDKSKNIIYDKLSERVVSSEENICNSTNFIDIIKVLVPNWLFVRSPHNLDYKEMWNNSDVVSRKPFCGIKDNDELNLEIAQKFPTLWKKPIVDLLSQGQGFCIKNMTMYRDHRHQMIKNPFTVDGYYFVGPIWDNIDYDNIENSHNTNILRYKFNTVINNIMTNVYYKDDYEFNIWFVWLLMIILFSPFDDFFISSSIYFLVNNYIISHRSLFASVIGGRFQILKNSNDPKNHPTIPDFSLKMKDGEFKKLHNENMNQLALNERIRMANYMISKSQSSTFDEVHFSVPKELIQ